MNSNLVRIPRLFNLIKYRHFIPIFNVNKIAQRSSISNYALWESSNLRNYSIQSSFKKLESTSSNPNIHSSLEQDFQAIDSILKRGGFLRKKTIEKLCNRVKKSADFVTPSQTLFLLRCCGSSVNAESSETRNALVSKIWNTIQTLNLPLDISHYNALLSVFLENENKFSPLDFLASLESKNIEPNRITYSRLLARYCQDGDIDGANKILEFMKEKELPIGEYVFNHLIIGNSRANDLEAACNVVELMKQSNINPSSETYSKLLQAYAEHEDVDKMNQLLNQYDQEGITISDKGLMDLICTLANKNLRHPVTEIVSSMKKKDGYQGLVQHAMNSLLHSGHVEVAFELYKTLSFKTDYSYAKGFFFKQLASSNADLYKVINICDEVRHNGWNIIPYELVLESYLIEDKFDMAMGLLRVMKEKGLELKEHYFYPLICNISKSNDKEKMFEFLEELIRMGVNFESQLISAYFLPAINPSLNIEAFEELYMRFSNYRGEANLSSMYNGIVEYLLKNEAMDVTAKFVNKFRRGVEWSLRNILCDRFLKTNDVVSTVSVLRQMLPFSIRVNKEMNASTELGFVGIREFLGLVISRIDKEIGINEHLVPLLMEMEDKGVGICPSVLIQLQNRFKGGLVGEAAEILERLADTETMLSKLDSSFNSGIGSSNSYQSVESLRQKIRDAESSGEESTQLNIRLIISLIKQKKLSEAEELYNKFKANDVSMPPPIQVMLFDLYLEEKNYVEAEKTIKSLFDENPNFLISSHKTLKWAQALVELGRINEVSNFLLTHCPKDGEWPTETSPNLSDPMYRRRILNLLNAVVEVKDLETLKLIQDTLINKGLADEKLVLPSLIKYFVNEDNLSEAMVWFEKIVEEHKVTPAKELLTVACIAKEDTEKIQKIMDLSITVHGEMNTLYDLVYAFLEVGKIEQAQKVFETHGLRAFQNRLNDRCELYLRSKKVEQLEGLVKVSKALFQVDRPVMYEYLLKSMIQEDDPERALGVWTSMQEEGLEPSNLFLSILSKYLISKGLEVPFVVPHTSAERSKRTYVTSPRPIERVPKEPVLENIYKQCNRVIESQNVDEIRSFLKRIEETHASEYPVLHSQYINSLLHNNRLNDAFEETKSLLTRNFSPSNTLMKNLLTQLAKAKDIVSLSFIGKYLDTTQKRKSYYGSSLGNCYLNAGKYEEFLTLAEETISKSPTETILTPKVVDAIIKEKPELYPIILKCADIQKEGGSTRIYQMLWDVLFSQDKTSEAEELYEKYLNGLENFPVRMTCSQSYLREDTEKLDELLKVLDRKPEGREYIKGYVFSTYMDIFRKRENFDEAMKVMDRALQSIKLEHFPLDKLNQMKYAMKKKNIDFPHQIPTQVESDQSLSSSSSSSSDEEKK